MKPFKLYKIVLLLFIFGINNLYAVQSATIDQSKIEAVAAVSATKTIKNNTKKPKRKSRLIEKLKEKFSSLFSKSNTQENALQNENLETKTDGLAQTSLFLGIIAPFMIFTTLFLGYSVGLGLSLSLSFLAFIFGIISIVKIKTSGGSYTGIGVAIIGLILGLIPLSLLLIDRVTGGF